MIQILYSCFAYAQENGTSSDYDLTEHVVYFKTKDTSLQIEQIIDSFKCDKFKQLPDKKLTFWCEDELYWFVVKIPNHFITGTYYLQIDNRRIQKIKVYITNGNLKPIKEFKEVGDQFDFNERIISATEFAFPVQLTDSSSYVIFKFYNPWRKTTLTKLFLFPENNYIIKVSNKLTFSGFILGIWAFAFLIVCLVILNSGIKRYFVFLLHFGTLIIYHLSITGLGFQYVWSDFPMLNIYTLYFILVSSSFYTYFLYRYFLMEVLKSNFLKWCFLSNILISILFMFIIIYHALYRSNYYVLLSKMMYSTILFYITLFAFSLFWYLFSKRNILASILVIANLFSIIAGIFIGLAGANIILKTHDLNQIILLLFTTDLVFLLIYIILQTKNKYKEFVSQKIQLQDLVIEQQKTKLERQNLLSEERSRIASEMHDDLGSGLTTIRYLTDKALETSHKEDKTQIKRISEQSKALINNLGEIIWAMNSSQDSLDNLLSYTRRYLSENCDEFGIKLIWDRPVAQAAGIVISGERRRHFFLVVKEAFHNIVKHSNASEVNVDFRLQESKLHFDISDNGKGFDINHLKKGGNGLINMEKRMKKLNGSLTIVHLAQGIRLTIKFVPDGSQ